MSCESLCGAIAYAHAYCNSYAKADAYAAGPAYAKAASDAAASAVRPPSNGHFFGDSRSFASPRSLSQSALFLKALVTSPSLINRMVRNTPLSPIPPKIPLETLEKMLTRFLHLTYNS